MELPLSSHSTIGVADTPHSVKVTICNSGKARPMPSPSTSGRPLLAATTKGVVEFTPPASPHSTASILRPITFSSAVKAFMSSSPCGSFSVITVGAPIMQTGTTSASSASSPTSTSLTGPWRRIACWAISLPT